MSDDFLELFSWLTPLVQRPTADVFSAGSPEEAVLQEFSTNWGQVDTVDLLKGLSEKYGPLAAPAIEHFMAACITKDWARIGNAESHPGTEVQDFLRVLWQPLRVEGFEFTQKDTGGRVELTVTRCPVYELAKRTGMHTWLYHLACATDFYNASSFSDKIEFSRTKTLMESHECCNHAYSRKANR